MNIYLAGDLKSNWQDSLLPSISAHTVTDPRKFQGLAAADYTAAELAAIRACDVLIACMRADNPSGYGLMLEAGYALGLSKRIIFWDAVQSDRNRSRFFDMLRAACGCVCYSVSDVVDAL